jgi:hypothetical protein
MDITRIPLLIFEHRGVTYAQPLAGELIVKLPRGMVNLKEIEDYVQNIIDSMETQDD